jgi:hypothetical protein
VGPRGAVSAAKRLTWQEMRASPRVAVTSPMSACHSYVKHHMRSGQPYMALAQSLEDWRSRPAAALVAAVGRPAEVEELLIDGEIVRVETSVSWVDAKNVAVLVEAVAYGPSTLLTERVSERIRIDVQQEGGGDA